MEQLEGLEMGVRESGVEDALAMEVDGGVCLE